MENQANYLEPSTPLIIPIDEAALENDVVDDDVDDGDEETANALQPFLPTIQASGNVPRRRPVTHGLGILDGDDDDGDDTREEQPPLPTEIHWVFTLLIQLLTGGVALAIMCGIHELVEKSGMAVVGVFGALLVGSFWTASGLALTLKRSRANRRAQIVILVAPLAYLVVSPLALLMPFLSVMLVVLSFSLACYVCYPRVYDFLLDLTPSPKTSCIRSYKFLLIFQLLVSLTFWVACFVDGMKDFTNPAELLLNFPWMIFVRYFLFADAKKHIPIFETYNVANEDGVSEQERFITATDENASEVQESV